MKMLRIRVNFCLSISWLLITILQIGACDEARCPSHCDVWGRFVESVKCGDSSPYCCGNVTTMFCCNDWRIDISDVYTDLCFCAQSNCLYRNWEAIASVITMVVLFIVVTVCCCMNQCNRSKPLCNNALCLKCCPNVARACFTFPCCCCVTLQHEGSATTTSRAGVVDEERGEMGPGADPVFNPNSEFALHPPDYETVCKDPPKYEEVGWGEEEAPAYTALPPSLQPHCSLDDQSGLHSNGPHIPADTLNSGSHSNSGHSNGSHGDSIHGNGSHTSRSHTPHRNGSHSNRSHSPGSHSNGSRSLHRNGSRGSRSHSSHGNGSHGNRLTLYNEEEGAVVGGGRNLSPSDNHYMRGRAWKSCEHLWEGPGASEDPPPYTEHLSDCQTPPTLTRDWTIVPVIDDTASTAANAADAATRPASAAECPAGPNNRADDSSHDICSADMRSSGQGHYSTGQGHNSTGQGHDSTGQGQVKIT